jgi:hypothetical protein
VDPLLDISIEFFFGQALEIGPLLLIVKESHIYTLHWVVKLKWHQVIKEVSPHHQSVLQQLFQKLLGLLEAHRGFVFRAVDAVNFYPFLSDFALGLN